MSFCSQSFKDLLKQYSTEKRDDAELLTLILDIYNAHKKCLKNVAQKETAFSAVMAETYKVFIQDKVVRMPENVSYVDLAMKLCIQEMNAKKNPAMKRLSLDECGTAGLSSRLHNISLPGLSSAMFYSPNNSIVSVGDTSISAAPKSMAPTGTVITTTTNAFAPSITTTNSTTTTTTTTSAYIPGLSRPRGRPPGSKNVNYSSIIPSTNITATTPRSDPSAQMSLYSNPALLATMSQFTDPVQIKTFLNEYFRLTNTGNIPQLMSGFAGQSIYSPPTTATPPSPKPPKAPKTIPVSSSVTISPSHYTSKSATTIPSNTANTSTISSSAANAYKSGASTVISVGSGQLTITPTLSITPQPSVIPPVNQSKPRKSAEMKRKPTAAVVASIQSKKLCTDLSTAKSHLPHDLPKSLSIIPTPSGMPNKPIPNLTPVVPMHPEKAAKTNKPKKKATTSNFSFGGLGMAGVTNTNDLISKYMELMRSTATTSPSSFLSQYEQFCSLVPPGLGAQPSLLKSKAAAPSKSKPSGSGAQAQQGMISVKQLEALQGKATKSSTKSVPPFQMPPMPNKPSPSTSSGTVLNSYPVSLGNLAYSPYINATAMMQTNTPSTLQIRLDWA